MRIFLALPLLLLAAASASAAAPAARNLILISLDDLRWDRTAAGSPLTPELQRFESSAAVFDSAYAPATWTLPSHASLLTALDPVDHGAGGRPSDPRVMRPGIQTLAERLKAAGFATAGFYSSDYLGPRTGLQKGYDLYVKPERVGVFGAALDWLARPPKKRWFLFLHTRDVHRYLRRRGPVAGPPYRCPLAPADAPYPDLSGEPTPADCERALRAYDNAAFCDDQELGSFFEVLSRRGLLGDTAVAIVSDHGEALCDPPGRRWGHAQAGYEEQTHVVFILRFPPRLPPGHYHPLVSLTDVTPTLLDLAGLPPPFPTDGGSLVDVVAGRASGRPAVLSEGDRWISVRAPDARLLSSESDGARLFTPDGREWPAGQKPASAGLLRSLLAERLSKAARASDDMVIDEKVRENLKAAGYLP